jgi:proteasome lid subunit RPN8/RPN11
MTDVDVTTSLIKLSPLDLPQPKGSRMPLTNIIRWEPNSKTYKNQIPMVSVFVTQPALSTCVSFAESDLKNETGGWLLGKWRKDYKRNQQYIVVDTVLQAQFTRNSSTYLTFTQDSQVSLRRLLDEKHPGKELVGWFHTHPNMGVFLSHYDLWLHQHFFPEKWQVALVLEPVSRAGGFFIRTQDGTLASRSYFGFSELLGRERQSVVDWINLQPDLS